MTHPGVVYILVQPAVPLSRDAHASDQATVPLHQVLKLFKVGAPGLGHAALVRGVGVDVHEPGVALLDALTGGGEAPGTREEGKVDGTLTIPSKAPPLADQQPPLPQAHKR